MADAAFVRPPQLFIDMWRANTWGLWHRADTCEQCGGYNEETGYCWLYDLKDITYEQALAIMSAGRVPIDRNSYNTYARVAIRTHLPCAVPLGGAYEQTFWNNYTVETVAMPHARLQYYSLYLCGARTVICNHSTPDSQIALMSNLENLVYTGALDRKPRGYNRASKLTGQSVLNIINAYQDGTNEIAITVHPMVYAKLTDETNEEWYALIAAAEAKNIVFATP